MALIDGIQSAIYNTVTSSFKEASSSKGVLIAVAIAALALVAIAFTYIVFRQVPTATDWSSTAPDAGVIGYSLPHAGTDWSTTTLDAGAIGYSLPHDEAKKIKNFFQSDAPLEGFYLNSECDAHYQKEIDLVKATKHSQKFNPIDSEKFIKESYPSLYAILEKEFIIKFKPRIYVCYHKALAYRELYRDSHYVFLHGRSIEWKIYACLIKELLRLLKPEYHYKLYKFLRVPSSMDHFKNAEDFMAHHVVYSDGEGRIRQQLISADAYWLSDVVGESALRAFIYNCSIFNGPMQTCKQLIDAYLDEHVQDREAALEQFVERIKQLVIEIKKKVFPGELLVVCIPKSVVKNPITNPIYRSHAIGQPCQCNGTHLDTDFLDQLQDDKVPSSSTCSWVQYRLLASHLLPKNGVRIFGFTDMDSEAKENTYRQPIKEIAQEIVSLSQSTQETVK